MGKDPNQPEPPGVGIPFNSDGDALYCQMPIDDLIKLRNYMDDLIKWIKAGNPIYLGTYYAVITVKEKP